MVSHPVERGTMQRSYTGGGFAPPLKTYPALNCTNVGSVPRILNGSIFFLTCDGSVVRRETSTNDVLWRTDLETNSGSSQARAIAVNDRYVLGQAGPNWMLSTETGELLNETPDGMGTEKGLLIRDVLISEVGQRPDSWLEHYGFEPRGRAGKRTEYLLRSTALEIEETRWEHYHQNSHCHLTLSEDESVFYVTDIYRGLSCRRVDNGEVVWRKSLDDYTLANEGITDIDADARRVRFEIGGSSGEVGFPGPGSSYPEEFATELGGFPVAADGLVYVAAKDHWVLAIEPETGNLAWSRFVPNRLPEIHYDPSTGDLFMLDSSAFTRLDAATGEPKAAVSFEPYGTLGRDDAGIVEQTGFEVTENALWAANKHEPVLYAFSKKNGDVIWESELPEGATYCVVPPVIADGRLYQLDYDNNLWAYEQA